ncbi:MAG: RNA polymerase subunit sigma-24 [Gemmataceae bacterium]|nr:RNA polymerase subunit sigma-24 [Gemmataceae bacterium]
MSEGVPRLVEHLFRHESGKLMAGLTRKLGAGRWELAEESVQEAMVRALKIWPFQGLPPNPAGWLARTAHNFAIDRLRREAGTNPLPADLIRHVESAGSDSESIDDQLAMMFACCHPALSPESQVALTLKSVCGFSVAEIARAFLTAEPTVAQRLVRAKRTLAAQDVPVAVPPPGELPERLDAVLATLYLLFNEGYSAHIGDDLVREELCTEAIRLTRWLAHSEATSSPRVHALLALQFLQSSRLAARTDASGNLLLLAEQDRSQWDQRLIHAGIRHLDAASEGDSITQYHIEAGIAAVHAIAPDDASTDWAHLLRLYDRLLGCTRSPVVELNRAVALARVEGPDAGLAALEPLRVALGQYFLYHAVLADLQFRLGRRNEAARAYRAALALPCSNPERRFLQSRLACCET